MSILYPHISFNQANALAEERSGQSIQDLYRTASADLSLSNVFYTPTGGSRVSEAQLIELQQNVRSCAQSLGYPNFCTEEDAAQFDCACAELLFDKMDVTASEASDLRIWCYLTCVLLPDVVRWRFPGERSGQTSLTRFIGSDRGMRRNTLGRLWWRAFLLHLPDYQGEKYKLIKELHEDELVQITERPSLAADPVLSKELALAFLSLSIDEIAVSRRILFRDVVKRFRRLFPLVGFHCLESSELKLLVDFVFNQSINAFNDA